MDRFDLNWPNADAEFFTDGWRCRIVWRQKGKRQGGGIGGTIDNNVQCVLRVAESLDGAPYLLSALKARGHERLAGQIESAVGESHRPTRQVTQPPATAARAKPKRAERAPVARRAPELVWLQSLPGSDAFSMESSRRAKVWLELGTPGSPSGSEPKEVLFLKTPAAKGKQEWVIKRTWPDEAKRKAEYVAAVNFRGVASYLLGAGATQADIERLLKATRDVAHEELTEAASAWRKAAG